MTGSDTSLVSQSEAGHPKPNVLTSRPQRVDTPLNHLRASDPRLPLDSSSGPPTDFQYGNARMEQARPTPQARQPKVEPIFSIPPVPPPLPPPPPLSGLDLPPPPEFRNKTVPSHAPVLERHAFVEKIDHEQETLRDSRDEVLGSRFRLQARRRELRELREETGAKDGSVFNLFRRYLHEINVSIPNDIEEAFSEASLLRDRLGVLEAEYDEAELNYNTLEWNYTRKESQFVESLVETDLVPNSTLKLTSGDPESSDSNIHLDEPPSTWPDANHLDDDGPGTELEVVAEPNDRRIISNIPTVPHLRRGSSLRSTHSIARSARRHSENSHSHTPSAWLAKLNRIDEWLFDIMSNSRLHQAQLKAMHDLDYPDEDSWLKRVRQYWSIDTEEVPVFHTGDSTVSRRLVSQHYSTSTIDIMEAGGSVVKVENSTPLLPGDHNLDALEATSRPNSIQAGDLSDRDAQYDLPPEHRTTEVAVSSTSVSTGATPSHCTSSSGGCDTETTWDHPCACRNCILRTTQLPRFRRERFDGILRIQQNPDQDNQSAPATPTQRGQNSEAVSTPRMLSDSIDLRSNEHMIQAITKTLCRVQGTPHPSRNTSDSSSVLKILDTSIESHHKDPSQVPLPPSPHLSPSPTSETTKRQCPIASPILTEGARKWSQFPFPLLPLTTTAVRPCSHGEHQLNLKDFPFVSGVKLCIPLPGPSDDMYS